MVVSTKDEYGDSNTRFYLQKLGYNFEPNFRISNSIIPFFLTNHPEIITVSSFQLYKGLQQYFSLISKPYPFPDEKKSITMIWHKANTQVPFHQWLRQLIKRVLHSTD